MRNLMMVLVALGLGTKRNWHIFIAIFLGLLLGYWFPYDPAAPSFMHEAWDVVGQVFIRLVAMLAIPLIISSLLIGLSSLGDGRQLGKIGGKTLFYFALTMVIAATLAAVIGSMVQPGLHVAQQFLSSNTPLTAFQPHDFPQLSSFKELVLNLVPQNPFEALAKRDLVPVIIFTLLLGTAMATVGDTARPFISFFEAVFAATMRMVDWVMIFAVPGVFALTFTAMSHGGTKLFATMLPYFGAVIVALAVHVLVIYPLLLAVFARVSFLDLYRAISEAILVAFGTASSSATLPVTMACIERRAGVSNRVASFVLPTGVSLNMNGTTIFQVISILFLAQLYGIPLTFQTVVTVVVMAIIASIGAAGVPAAGMITLSVVLNSIGGFRPEQVVEGLSLIWAVERVLDMCRTTVNVIDDSVVAVLVAASEGELNRDRLTAGDQWQDVV